MHSSPQAARPFVVHAHQVRPFTLPGDEAIYESRMLVGPDGAGSAHLLVNQFVVRAGQLMTSHVHPDTDESYYVISGRGRLVLGFDGTPGVQEHDAVPGMTAFIPAGTAHRMENPYDTDLTMLTIWPQLPQPGSNPIYDARLDAWGTTFRAPDES